MGLQVNLVGVSVGEGLSALATLQWAVRSVKLLDMYLEISFAAAGGWAEFTLKDRLVARVN